MAQEDLHLQWEDSFPRPLEMVDTALFTILTRRKEPPLLGNLALPGGFVDVGEDCDTDAKQGDVFLTADLPVAGGIYPE